MTKFSTLRCKYFPLCPGCEVQGDVSLPPIYEELKTFFAPHLPLSLTVKEITGWRHRSKLAVRGTVSRPQIGLFKQGSHDVISIPSCPLHHPSINRVCAHVQRKMIELKIAPYCEKTHQGCLRYLQCAVERKTGRVQLVLVVNHKDPALERFVQQLYIEEAFHSLWLNVQPARTNRIFGDEWILCKGEPYLWETLCQVDCAFHPACFGQAHLSLYDDVLNTIQTWVPPNQNILELYAGMGTIGLNLASQSTAVTCVEINPYAKECFEASRLKLPSALQDKITFETNTADQAQINHDLVIVDPPRKGLEPKVLEAIHQGTSQLIYLSCGPQSFQRDCEYLLARGWKIERAEGYLFFPGTNHVEILCKLTK